MPSTMILLDSLIIFVIIAFIALVVISENKNAKIRVGRKITTIRDYLFPPLLPIHMSPAITTAPLKSINVEGMPYMRV